VEIIHNLVQLGLFCSTLIMRLILRIDNFVRVISVTSQCSFPFICSHIWGSQVSVN